MDIHSKVIPLELHPMGFIEAFTHYGADLDQLLEKTMINRNMLSTKGIKISYQQQSQLITNGIELCNRDGLGLLVGMYMDWSYNGSVGSVVHCSPSLREAGAAMRRYLVIAQPYYAMYVGEPNVYIDENQQLVNPIRFFVNESSNKKLFEFELEYRLAVTLRLIDECGNKNIADPGVHLYLDRPKPAHYALYEQLPVSTITFDCEQTAISSHYTFFTETWRELRRPNFDRLMTQCEEELSEAKIETSFSAKVRWHVGLYFNEQVSLETIAGYLSMTPRALTRKLALEGTSFRNIVHEVRMELTAFHLRSSTLSVDRISEIMGFSSPSSLRRAVKNWSGETAGDLRASAPAVLSGNAQKQQSRSALH